MLRRTGIWLVAAFAVVLASVGASQAQKKAVTILTGSPSGIYYPLGEALAEILEGVFPDTTILVRETGGSVENLNLIQQGRGQLGFAQTTAAKDAWDGERRLGFMGKLDKLRAVAVLYPSYVHIIATSESGILTLHGLGGGRVSVGADRSGTLLTSRAILEAAGIPFGKLGRVAYLSFSETVEEMKNGRIDVAIQTAGLGVESIAEVAQSVPIRFIPLSPEVAASAGQLYFPGTIPAGTYPGQNQDVPTVQTTNVLVTSVDASDEFVYAVAKALFDNLDVMIAAHSGARGITLDGGPKGLPIPLHPGAAKFYEDAGILNLDVDTLVE